MGERRDAIEFDLTAAVADSGSLGPGDDASPPDRRRWRGPLIAAGVVAVLALGVVAGTFFQERRSSDLLLSDPHGLRSIPTTPTEAWSAPGAAVVLADDVVVTVTDGVARGLDPATGTELWSHDLGIGADINCGEISDFARVELPAEDPLVCVTEDAPYRVSAVDDGELVTARDIEADDDALVRPGPGGGVIVAERDGEPVDMGSQFAAGYPVSSDEGPNLDESLAVEGVDLSMQDAGTEGYRWTSHLDPLAEAGSGSCIDFSVEGTDPAQGGGRFDPNALWLGIEDSVVHVYGCGIEAEVSDSGVVLEGSEGNVKGSVLVPVATDGSDIPTFVAREASARLTALDGDDERWSADLDVDRVLAATSELVIVKGRSAVVALDASTGEQRWENGEALADNMPFVFLDDERVVLAPVSISVDRETGTVSYAVTLEALGLADGKSQWARDLGQRAVRALDGRLVTVDEEGVEVLT